MLIALLIALLVTLLAIFVIAAGIGAARENGTRQDGSWSGWSRSRAKKYFRSRGLRLAAGQLAAIMGELSWAPQPLCGPTFTTVPSTGRSWTGQRRRALREDRKAARREVKVQRVVAPSSFTALAAKRGRDLAATSAKMARRAERQPQRARGKGVWAAQVRAELAERRKALAAKPWPARAKADPQPMISWLDVVRAARRPQALVALARGTSKSALHLQADALEAVLAAERLLAGNAQLIAPGVAREFGVDFQMARASIAARWAICELREELLAA